MRRSRDVDPNSARFRSACPMPLWTNAGFDPPKQIHPSLIGACPMPLWTNAGLKPPKHIQPSLIPELHRTVVRYKSNYTLVGRATAEVHHLISFVEVSCGDSFSWVAGSPISRRRPSVPYRAKDCTQEIDTWDIVVDVSRAVTFTPMPMPKPKTICITNVYNKWVQ